MENKTQNVPMDTHVKEIESSLKAAMEISLEARKFLQKAASDIVNEKLFLRRTRKRLVLICLAAWWAGLLAGAFLL